jgi:hypothetical protein
MMADFQVWLVDVLSRDTPVSQVMRTAWAWPIMESLHFVGLSMLIGGISIFDLRLLGVGRRIPVQAAHRLVPVAIAGWCLSLLTGITFLMTDSDQYVYNPSFQLKVLLMGILGANAGVFYLTSYGRILAEGGTGDVPRRAKLIATISLTGWMAVIACGRLITFYRPGNCAPEAVDTVLQCIP